MEQTSAIFLTLNLYLGYIHFANICAKHRVLNDQPLAALTLAKHTQQIHGLFSNKNLSNTNFWVIISKLGRYINQNQTHHFHL